MRRDAARMPSLAAALLATAFFPVGAAWAAPAASEIDKFFRVNEQVCTGAQPTRDQLVSLKAEGIHGIINLREPQEHDSEEEAKAAKDLGLVYLNIPVKAAAPTDEQVAAFLTATNEPKIFPLFIHCGSGNRVGAFWMIRRVLVDGWTPDRAEEQAKQIGMKSPNLREFALDYVRRHPNKAP